MVLIFSKEADDSVHVKKEVFFAEKQKKIIIPFKIDEYIPDKLAYFLAFPQWLDGIRNIEAAFSDLCKRLEISLGVHLIAQEGNERVIEATPIPRVDAVDQEPELLKVEEREIESLLSILPEYQDWASNSDVRTRLKWDKEKLKAVTTILKKDKKILYLDGSGGAIALMTKELSNLEEQLEKGEDHYPYFVNVGEDLSRISTDANQPNGTTRHWDDFRKYGFISAGGGPKFAKQMQNIPIGAEVYTYISGFGYVGQARVLEEAVPIDQYVVNGTKISSEMLAAPNALRYFGNHEMCEWLVRVEWTKAIERSAAIKKTGLYVHVGTSCRIKDPISIKYLREKFSNE